MKEQETLLMMAEQFLRIINKYNQIESTPVCSENGMPLNPAEIHTIEAIGKHDGTNITELARIQGITKGGVSQMIAKLGKKGLVAKTKDGLNDKEVKLRLTPAGLKAFRGHENMHAAMYSDLLKLLEDVNHTEVERIREILSKIEGYMDKYMSEKK